jgi:hypothetical protein
LHYWTQIQIQLEVADLDRCDFLECEIQELKSVEEFLSLEIIDTSQQKGILLNKTEFPNNSEEKYIYPPDNITLAQEYIDWSVEIIKELEAQAVKVEPIYFHIHKWNVVIVKRRKDWFASVRPIIKQVWEFITRLQQNREDFLKYQESIHIIKSKKFIEKWTNTTCMIEHDSDEECFPDKMDEDIECVCLINSTE